MSAGDFAKVQSSKSALPTQGASQKLPPDGDKPPPATVPDAFSPESLRLSQDFIADLGVTKQLLTIPVRKPPKERWVRTHPAVGKPDRCRSFHRHR